MPRQCVAIHFLRSAIASVEEQRSELDGEPTGPWMSARLEWRDVSQVTAQRATELMQTLWRMTDDELLGLGPRPVPRGTFRMISLGLIHSPDLRTALDRMMEFLRISTGFTYSRLVEDGPQVRIELGLDRVARSEPLATEIMMGFIHRFAAWLIGQRISLTRLDMPFPEPGYSNEYTVIFGRLAAFDAPVACLGFEEQYLAAPIVRDETELLAFVRHSPANLIFRRDYGSTIADRVRKILERSETTLWPKSEQVAERLSMSSQHMRRRLSQEETSFRAIREGILRDAALASLEMGSESIDQLSDRLGFSEPRAFRRAFIRWLGSSPGAYRSAHARARK